MEGRGMILKSSHEEGSAAGIAKNLVRVARGMAQKCQRRQDKMALRSGTHYHRPKDALETQRRPEKKGCLETAGEYG